MIAGGTRPACRCTATCVTAALRLPVHLSETESESESFDLKLYHAVAISLPLPPALKPEFNKQIERQFTTASGFRSTLGRFELIICTQSTAFICKSEDVINK